MYEILVIVVQIIAEALPISSSTHQSLVVDMLNYWGIKPNRWVFERAIDFMIHLPTAGVLLLYFFYSMRFELKKTTKKEIMHLGSCVILSTLVTCILYPLFKNELFMALPSWIGLLITSCALFSLRYTFSQVDREISWRDAAILGIGQACALLPGISRLAFTLALLQWLGYSARFSFYYTTALQIVLFGAAGTVGLAYTLVTKSFLITSMLVLSSSVASVVAYLFVCLVAHMTFTNTMWYFAFYTTILACFLYGIS